MKSVEKGDVEAKWTEVAGGKIGMIWWEWRNRKEEKEPVAQRRLVLYSKEEVVDIRELGKKGT